MALTSPYSLTAGQAALATVGLMYVACLGFACLTLAVSSRTRSTLAVFLADVALVLLTGLVPSAGVGALERVLALFPINFANFSVLFSALESYPLGPVVLDLIGMVLIVYAALALVSTPVAALSLNSLPLIEIARSKMGSTGSLNGGEGDVVSGWLRGASLACRPKREGPHPPECSQEDIRDLSSVHSGCHCESRHGCPRGHLGTH